MIGRRFLKFRSMRTPAETNRRVLASLWQQHRISPDGPDHTLRRRRIDRRNRNVRPDDGQPAVSRRLPRLQLFGTLAGCARWRTQSCISQGMIRTAPPAGRGLACILLNKQVKCPDGKPGRLLAGSMEAAYCGTAVSGLRETSRLFEFGTSLQEVTSPAPNDADHQEKEMT